MCHCTGYDSPAIAIFPFTSIFPLSKELVPAEKMVPVKAERLAAVILPVTVCIGKLHISPAEYISAELLHYYWQRPVEKLPTDPPRIVNIDATARTAWRDQTRTRRTTSEAAEYDEISYFQLLSQDRMWA